jgi:hypothetical protein
VLPFSASDHPGTDGPILVYDFAGASSVAYRAAALPPRESVGLIRKIRGEIADV